METDTAIIITLISLCLSRFATVFHLIHGGCVYLWWGGLRFARYKLMKYELGQGWGHGA
jgi:hypothetical protein